ncbi:PorP/SprF family type IX secretion system membrane protein [Flavobacterium sp.]|jgi:type IX secretion system PorP/SprF family membrane protein|uniref:PorP/SprF family type IX secretion system membrane protein n=1 Tax=Flavobacterium sp. TaxID=239 RepID=UPI0037C0FF20
MKNTIILIGLLFSFGYVKAQDPVFTQFFMIPQSLSSSFAGAKEVTNAGIIHRTQWPGIDFSINSQFAYIDNWFEEMNSGVGISVLNHKETTTRYDFTQVNFNYALKVQINEDWYFRPSLSLGYGSKSFGFQDLLLGDQIDINNGVIHNTSIDPILLNDKINFFDFSTSFLFNNENSWLGVTLKHLNRPSISMAYSGNNQIDLFLSVHSSIAFPLNTSYGRFEDEDSIYLLTNFMKQGEYSRFDMGPQYVKGNFSFAVLAATNPIRTNPNSHFLTSINSYAGFKYEGFKFGYSYDYNMSKIGKTGGVYEISISYEFDKSDRCWGCPKYY